MKEHNAVGHGRGLEAVLALLLAALFTALAWAFLAAGPPATGLGHAVDAALVESGVQSRVTAVLLNYRAYDTLLECFVLFLGVVVVWSLRPLRAPSPGPALGPILASLLRFLVPLMVLVGSYLLWAGSDQAGGAFQAGAIFGGAGVLLLLTSSPLLAGWPKSLLAGAICLGPLYFLLVALATMASCGNFLEYRREMATMVMVSLEAVAALSIGLSLAALFWGRRPERAVTTKARDGASQSEGDTS